MSLSLLQLLLLAPMGCPSNPKPGLVPKLDTDKLFREWNRKQL